MGALNIWHVAVLGIMTAVPLGLTVGIVLTVRNLLRKPSVHQ